MIENLNLKSLNSNLHFKEIYKKFILSYEKLTFEEINKLLIISILLLNSEDMHLKEFGYRIIVIYTNRSKNYKPLYEVSLNIGLYPLTKMIEENQFDSKTLSSIINDSFLEFFHHGKIYLSHEQKYLKKFMIDNDENNILVKAPTSFGKTDIIIDVIRSNTNKSICIITPTKSLLNQTKMRILSSSLQGVKKIITFPEMYKDTDQNIIAVLTQERLLRLFKNNKQLFFDIIIVDESHNLFEDNFRSYSLIQSLIVGKNRLKSTRFLFLSPFINDIKNLDIIHTNIPKIPFFATEKIKTEKYYYYNENGNELYFYDQFMDDVYSNSYRKTSLTKFVIEKSKEKNIVYLNKPRDTEDFANELSQYYEDVIDEDITSVIKNLEEYFHKDFKIINYLKRGVIYHHGSLPDQVRYLIEDLYINNENIKYVSTTSTLLEGVNLPANRMFILDVKKGRSNLRSSQFKNLVGRVSRYNDIFSSQNTEGLEPEIYLVNGKYFPSRTKPLDFLKRTTYEGRKDSDNLSNVLLENTKNNDKAKMNEKIEFIENFEKGVFKENEVRYVKTKLGESCILNNIFEFDIFEYEEDIQDEINKFSDNLIIRTSKDLLEIMQLLFFSKITNKSFDDVKRLNNKEALDFYDIFLSARINMKSFNEMINIFLRYWENLPKQNSLVYVGSRWGEEKREGFRTLWVNIKNKNKFEKVNLAIVRIKDEFDFLDNNILKYVEVLNDMKLMDESLYLKIKYGTEVKEEIVLVKNGLNVWLVKLLFKKYSKHIKIDVEKEIFKVEKDIIQEMKNNSENKIYILEVMMHITK